MRRIGPTLLLAIAVVPRDAHAEVQARARLSYVVEAGAETCPAEPEMRDLVAARLGYDPFAADAQQEVVVRIGRRARGIAGAFELKGPKPGQREIASPGGDCREVADALATAIAISLDPASLGRPTPPP
ncbi:MAG TPA: hypothetical protein VM925_37740, partial [Labilithrix sp.]|nr:hypothetical protein [Labilithrix sp.]